MWERVFDSMVDGLIRKGRLEVVFPDGQRRSYGPGGDPAAEVALTDRRALRALCLNPEMGLGEGYMKGWIKASPEGLVALLTVLVRNHSLRHLPAWTRLAFAARGRLRHLIQRNDPRRSRRNVAHHYDLSDDFYRLFLDADMQYSCAYFARPGMTLEEAQAAKKAHIADKLQIAPGMRVLDIGCGWGGMALTLARDYGARVTGVTLSENQLDTARARAEAAGLSDRTDFRLLDYRRLDERFDRIVSVGMLEHVGLPHFEEYFARVADLMEDDGIALIHSIVKSGPARPNNTWIDRYIFPGSYAPAASEVFRAIEGNWLYQCDDEALRIHYAETLKGWRERFEAAHDRVVAMFDEGFVRMWRFYLASMEVSFRHGTLHVQQWQLARRMDAVPMTRDYLYPSDRSFLQAAE